MQRNFKNKEDVVQAFLSFLITDGSEMQDEKDALSIVLGQLIAAVGFKGNEDKSKDFIIWLMKAQNQKLMSNYGFSGALMQVLKSGEALKYFNENYGLRKWVH